VDNRELLELAAKAAAIDPGYGAVRQGDFGLEFYGGGNRMTWNPLEDDGDALRLAVKLQMSVTVGLLSAIAETRLGMVKCDEGEIDGATRRAIVLAAAEIGKRM